MKIQSAKVLDDLILENYSITIDFDTMPSVLTLNASVGDSMIPPEGNKIGVLAGLGWLSYYYF